MRLKRIPNLSCYKRNGGFTVKKYFIQSDIHSFYDEWMNALNDAGFEKENPEHILIVLGDLFDRGNKSKEVLDFVLSFPSDRIILIRGNHEDLFMDYIYSGYPSSVDDSNGTVKTMMHLFGFSNGLTISDFNNNKVRKYFDRLVDYYESDHYIFVHSYIPLNLDEIPYAYKEDWRESTKKEWDQARWINPFDCSRAGFNKTGKTIVFGHWGNFLQRARNPFDSSTFDHSIYYGDGFIGLDTTTVISGKVNVLVIDEENM